MNRKFKQLTAGACAGLIACAVLTAPVQAQFEDKAKEAFREDCGIGMKASPQVKFGQNNYYIYTCSFIADEICVSGDPCANTVQRCLSGWRATRWNTAILEFPDINTPPVTIYKNYQCLGEPGRR